MDAQPFVNKNGQKIFTKYWTPEDGDKPRALVLVAHGLGEHCLYYQPIAEALTKKNILVFAHDHVGHGQTEGEQALISNFQVLVDDVIDHAEKMKEKYPDLPLFILGHSMGGTIALKAVLDHPHVFKGMILISPAIAVPPNAVNPFVKTVARVIARVSPSMQLSKLNPDFISQDKAHVQRYQDDPLVYHGGIKARTGLTLIDSMEGIKKRLSEINIPFLTQHGDQDKITDISGSRLLDNEASSTDKTFKEYVDSFHQLHYEPNGGQDICINELTSWITERM